MANVILHGELAEKFNPNYRLDVQSPKDALRALCLLVPNFKDTFQKGNYFLYVDAGEQLNIDEENITFKSNGDIHILPEMVGAKKKGLGKALAGIALIGLAFIPGVNAAVAGSIFAATGGNFGVTLAASSLIHATAVNIGITLALGGAAMLLAPKQKNNASDADSQQSYQFDGSDINIQNGACVPLIYGEVLAASFPISVDVSEAETNNVTTDSSYNTGAGNYTQTGYQTYQP